MRIANLRGAVEERTYFPIGSVVFFVLLTVFFGLIWFFMLWILAARG